MNLPNKGLHLLYILKNYLRYQNEKRKSQNCVRKNLCGSTVKLLALNETKCYLFHFGKKLLLKIA